MFATTPEQQDLSFQFAHPLSSLTATSYHTVGPYTSEGTSYPNATDQGGLAIHLIACLVNPGSPIPCSRSASIITITSLPCERCNLLDITPHMAGQRHPVLPTTFLWSTCLRHIFIYCTPPSKNCTGSKTGCQISNNTVWYVVRYCEFLVHILYKVIYSMGNSLHPGTLALMQPAGTYMTL